MTLNSIPHFDPATFAIGFEELFRRVQEPRQTNYPPYNIRKLDAYKYLIEIAVAGFSKDDVEIELHDNVLKVAGNIKQDDKEEFVYKGIAQRAFHRTFTLAEHIEVVGADLKNGLLTIELERIVPDHKKPRLIEIGDETTQPKLLNESKKK